MITLNPISPPIAREVCAWADSEFVAWRVREIDQEAARDEFVYNHLCIPEIASFVLKDSTVACWPKPKEQVSQALDYRACLYEQMLQASIQLTPALRPICLQIYVGDNCVHRNSHLPCFAFENTPDANTLLLPDFEFERDKYFEIRELFADHVEYAHKRDSAIFVGATTGRIITMSVAQAFDTPRLRSFKYFQGNDSVSFELPVLVQCVNEEVETFLRNLGVGNNRTRTWAEQFTHKFILSMDGNGATCSRVAVCLRSNSVLVRYMSPHKLFYFRGLTPGVHYLSVETDHEVEELIQREKQEPGHFAAAARYGMEFARDYLSREAVAAYISRMLHHYADRVQLDLPGLESVLGQPKYIQALGAVQ